MTGSAVGGTDGVFPAVAQETVSGSAIRRYTYDGFNRLVSYRSGETSAAYTYDAGDYRVAKQTTGPEGEGYTRYFCEGSRVVLEADADGAITAHNTYSINLASRTAGEEAYYYFYNAHGDVVGLSGAGGGEVVKYRYDAFGTPISVEGDADNSITYAGYQYDAESGLYYLNARYYDSMTARFLTEDTYGGRAGDPLSLHRYTYCANNPLRYTDPSGHFFGALLRFVGGAVIGGVIEYVNQNFIEKREKVDWKAVAYEALVGGVGALGGGGSKVVEGMDATLRGLAKRAVKAGAVEAAQGLLEDAGKQLLVDGKTPGEFDYGELFDTMAVAGVGGVFGAAADFFVDRVKHTKVKYVPVRVEVEEVHYQCLNHITDCSIHENNIRVVTKDTKWEMQEVWEYGGTDRSFMDYLEDHAKEQVAGKAPEDAPWRKLNLQFFAEDVGINASGQMGNNPSLKDVIQNSYRNSGNSNINDGLGGLDWTNADKKGRTALEHIQKHTKPNYQREMHGVFREDAQTVIEDAWSKRAYAKVVSDGMGGTVYNIPYYNVGYNTGYINFGQQMNYVTIVVRERTPIIWSAFPSFGDYRMKISN